MVTLLVDQWILFYSLKFDPNNDVNLLVKNIATFEID